MKTSLSIKTIKTFFTIIFATTCLTNQINSMIMTKQEAIKQIKNNTEKITDLTSNNSDEIIKSVPKILKKRIKQIQNDQKKSCFTRLHPKTAEAYKAFLKKLIEGFNKEETNITVKTLSLIHI